MQYQLHLKKKGNYSEEMTGDGAIKGDLMGILGTEIGLRVIRKGPFSF